MRRLVDDIENKEAFEIQVAGECLCVPASAQFNIEHEREGDTQELEFQLVWSTAAPR